jgi:hypothetical protein
MGTQQVTHSIQRNNGNGEEKQRKHLQRPEQEVRLPLFVVQLRVKEAQALLGRRLLVLQKTKRAHVQSNKTSNKCAKQTNRSLIGTSQQLRLDANRKTTQQSNNILNITHVLRLHEAVRLVDQHRNGGRAHPGLHVAQTERSRIAINVQ